MGVVKFSRVLSHDYVFGPPNLHHVPTPMMIMMIAASTLHAAHLLYVSCIPDSTAAATLVITLKLGSQ